MTRTSTGGWAVEVIQSGRRHFVCRYWNNWNAVVLKINPNLTGYRVAVVATRAQARELRTSADRIFPEARVVRVRVTVSGRGRR